MSTPVLDAELRTYESRRADLLRAAEGKYVLVHGDEVVGTYDTQMAAISAGYERFGNVPFLVKEIEEIETAVMFTSPHIAV